MLDRRQLLGSLIAAPLLIHARRAGARASLAPGTIVDADATPVTGTRADRSIPVHREATIGITPRRGSPSGTLIGRLVVSTPAGDRVAIRRALRTRVVAIDSCANANDRYQLQAVALDRVAAGAYILDTAGRAIGASGTSEEPGKVTEWFTVDRALADVVAAASKLPRRDRAPLAQGVVGQFRARHARVELGQPIELELEIANRGSEPATITFSPLNGSFGFAITRDGIAVPSQLAIDGPMGLRTLAPGAAIAFTADLRTFASIDRAGTYDLECTFAASAVPGTTFATRTSDTWDVLLAGAVRVTVA